MDNQTINENNDLINSLEEQVENLSSLLLVEFNIANLELEYSNLNYELTSMNNKQNQSEAAIESLEEQLFTMEFSLVENKSIKNSLQSQLDLANQMLLLSNQQAADLINYCQPINRLPV